MSSLRAYGLGEQTLDDMSRVRASGITFAPEAGSQRMRDVVNKNVTEEQLMQTAERIFSREWTSMKFYFMIGLPTETEDDVREIVRVGRRAREVGFASSAIAAPAAADGHRERLDARSETAHAVSMVRDGSRRTSSAKNKTGSKKKRAAHASICACTIRDGSWLEGVFARGDRTLCDVLETAYKTGARFDSWDDQLEHRSLGARVRSARDRSREISRHDPGERATSVESHRRRARRRISRRRISQGR